MVKRPWVVPVRGPGKIIDLTHTFLPPVNGRPIQILIGPDADESIPYHYKSTDRDDKILIIAENWYRVIRIDGGKGANEIQGTFGVSGYTDPPHGPFRPEVRNIQWALLRAEKQQAQLDFSRWTGLTYLEAHGLDGVSPDTLTDFFNIPNGTKIGISDFKGEVIFLFAPPPANARRRARRRRAAVDLSLYNAGGRVYLHKIAVINIHSTEWIASFLILDASWARLITVQGTTVDIQHSSFVSSSQVPLLTVDASAATGNITWRELSTHKVTIRAGRGDFNKITTNGNAGDLIDFLAGHSGHNTYIPLNLKNITHGANITQTIGLEALVVQILNFAPHQDTIDFRNLKISGPHPRYEVVITHENLEQPALIESRSGICRRSQRSCRGSCHYRLSVQQLDIRFL